ncbi:DUF945 family protein [Acetobacter pasteurianus]|uniref:DUF945 family protein n=1 Tax=Acetobacter pasteurianus TaxID=438 RepID=UPI000F58ACA8
MFYLRHPLSEMKQYTFLSLSVLGAVSIYATVAAAPAFAAPPSGCAVVSRASGQETAQGVTYQNLVLRTPDGGTTFKAGHLTLHGSGETPEAAHDLADAASLLLMSAMTGHHNAACTDWLNTQGKRVLAGLQAGKSYDLTWQNATLTHGAAQVSVNTARYQMQGGSATASASLGMDGVSFHNVANQDLLPTAAHATFSLPAAEVPALMSAIGGRSTSAPAVHATISSFDATQGDASLHGNGVATLTGNVNNTSASGHLEITNLETLIDKARTAKQMKLAAGMVVARLVSHKHGEQNTWDTKWESGVLTVNGFPIPLK